MAYWTMMVTDTLMWWTSHSVVGQKRKKGWSSDNEGSCFAME